MAKKLIYRNIFGRKVKTDQTNGGSTTTVTALPETGVSGVIYYNSTENKYYTYSNDSWQELGNQAGLPIVQASSVAKTETIEGSIATTYYDLEPNVYYLFGQKSIINLRFPLYDDGINVAGSFIGRFTCSDVENSTVNVTLNNGVHFADNIPDIEPGHTYEFNVLYDTCLITDITYTSNG